MSLKAFRILIISGLAALLVACGGGDGFGSGATVSDEPDIVPTTGVSSASLSLLVSSPELPSDDSSPVTLTALVRDANNNFVEGATIQFAASSGGIKVTGADTNDDGRATAQLSTGGDPTIRTVTVTATESGSGLSATQAIQVKGTKISIAGATSLELGVTTTLTASLSDSGGNAIAFQTLTISSALGNTLSATTLTTDSAGSVTVDVTAAVAGSDTITATALGVSGTFALSVAAPGTVSYNFTTPATTEPALGAALPLQVCWTDAGVPQGGQTLTFTSTRGNFISSGTPVATAITGAADGCANVTISSNIAGPASVSATSAGGLLAVQSIEFVATTPATVKAQASPSVVAGGQKSTITATVRDINYNLVKNQTVAFSIDSDPTNGTISPATGETDSFGQVSTVYTAGNVSSGKNNVLIRASVLSAAVTDQAELTATNKALSVALGTGNTMNNYSDTVYQLPYAAIVTNSAGGPVANQPVSITVWSKRYHKGAHYPLYNATSSFIRWTNDPTNAPALTGILFGCANEDLDANGIFDTAVDSDVNANGLLDPGNIATVNNTSGSSAVVTTNSDGIAEFNILYPEEYAYWLDVVVEARVAVDGTEDMTRASLGLPGLSEDYNDEKISPPGFTSPFGRGYDFGTATFRNCAVDERFN